MPKFRKKPIIIEAVRAVDYWERPLSEMPRWLQEAHERGDICVHQNGPPFAPFVMINTLNGLMPATIDEWILKGVAGELYPCKPEIFEATYEAME